MRPWRVIGMLGVVSLMNIGCDTAPPQAVIDAAESSTTQPEKARPTTQELLSGEYRKFMLSDMPLSLRAPVTWTFGTAANLQFIEGPSPTDQAMISFARRDPVANDRIEALIARLKGEDGGTTQIKSELRQAGQMRLLERIYTSRPITEPKLDSGGVPVADAQGNPVMVTTTTVHWVLMAFIPSDGKWDHYEVKAIGMTTDTYDANQRLLERILGSLTHEPGAAGAAPPAEPAGLPIPPPR